MLQIDESGGRVVIVLYLPCRMNPNDSSMQSFNATDDQLSCIRMTDIAKRRCRDSSPAAEV